MSYKSISILQAERNASVLLKRVKISWHVININHLKDTATTINVFVRPPAIQTKEHQMDPTHL